MGGCESSGAGASLRKEWTVPGSIASGAAAAATLRVVHTPCVRVASCLQMEAKGRRVRVRNRELGPRVGSYAAYLAQALNEGFAGEFTFAVDADTITVTASRIVDGQTIRLLVWEGITSGLGRAHRLR